VCYYNQDLGGMIKEGAELSVSACHGYCRTVNEHLLGIINAIVINGRSEGVKSKMEYLKKKT